MIMLLTNAGRSPVRLRTARQSDPVTLRRGRAHRASEGGYSRSSAYEPMARAMSAWAQNRWYVNEGAAPPLR